MSITLVRHTTPAIAAGVCYGRTDLEVADSFTEESAAVLPKISSCDMLISSPLRRCQLLADVVGRYFECPVTIDDRVREMDFGSWEGVAWSAIPMAELDEWANNFMHARPHGGESVADVQSRVREALTQYSQTGKQCVVITHAGVIKVAVAQDQSPSSFDTKIDFGGVISIDCDSKE